MKPLADALFNIYGNCFKFIYTEKLSNERKRLGWSEETADYLLFYYSDAKVNQLLIETADVVYFGANPNMFGLIKKRIYSGKLTYFHEERVLKHGIIQFFIPKYTNYYIEQRIKPTRLKNVYTLAASGFLYRDLKKLRAETSRVLRFGYFPSFDNTVKVVSELTKQDDERKNITILICGRMLQLKHFDDVIKAYSNIRRIETKQNVILKIVGNGVEENKLRALADRLCPQGSVRFMGALSPELTRKVMKESDIFIASSDKREGWGAVINEAMNSRCAVIVSDAMGAVPFLINEENGMVYKSGSIQDLTAKIQVLVEDSQLRNRMANNALQTISNLWNPQIAAERLCEFSKKYLAGEKLPSYDEGPLSLAKYI